MSSSIDPFHARVAQIALAVADRHGFALGGGLALIAHGVVDRPTHDIDLFGDSGDPVSAAAAEVRSALEAEGMRVVDKPSGSDLSDLIEGLDDYMAEMITYGDDGAEVQLSLGHLHRAHSPVILDIGPVMAMDDLIAWKVAALVNRAEPRDFVDVAVFLGDRTPDQLLAMARRVDPALEDEDVTRVGRELERIPDWDLEQYNLDRAGVARLRGRFAAWPR